MSAELSIHDWSRRVHGHGALSAHAHCYNARLDAWEPLLEPVLRDNVQRPWEIYATVFQVGYSKFNT